MEEYTKEGIPACEISFVDNGPLLDLYKGRNGLLKLLDEECLFPNGTADSLGKTK